MSMRDCPKMSAFLSAIASLRAEGEAVGFIGPAPAGGIALPLPRGATVLALSPHPDDPEAICVTLRRLMTAGNQVYFGIVCSGFDGVEDDYVRQRSPEAADVRCAKIAIRREEQVVAAEAFGLPDGHLTFLELEEGRVGQLQDTRENGARIAAYLGEIQPDIVLLPCGEDTNAGHVLTYRFFCETAPQVAQERGRPLVALYNEDPKTIQIAPRIYTLFDRETAYWKRGLLRFHDSQQQRNLSVRGHGFDDRILENNRAAFESLAETMPSVRHAQTEFAERFEVEVFGKRL